MNAEKSHSELLIRYLLGELSDLEQSELEQQYFSDPELFSELRATRDDLIDAYVRNELSSDLQQRFEKFFTASPRRREQVQFAEALLEAVNARQPFTVQRAAPASISHRLIGLFTSYRQPILVAGALVVLIAGSWFVIRTIRKQRAQSEQAQLHTPKPPVTESSVSPVVTGSPQPLASPPVSRTPTPESKPVFATFVLTSDLVRGSSETQKLVIPQDATIIRLRLAVEGAAYKNYSAAIRTPEGAEILSVKQLKPQPRGVVTLSLPANRLSNADYIIRLTAASTEGETVSAGNYYFRVEKR